MWSVCELFADYFNKMNFDCVWIKVLYSVVKEKKKNNLFIIIICNYYSIVHHSTNSNSNIIIVSYKKQFHPI